MPTSARCRACTNFLVIRRGGRPCPPLPRACTNLLVLRRGGVLPRPPPIFCFRIYASGGHISFNSERNMEKNAAKNQWFLDFLSPLAGAFRSVRNVESTYFSVRCRFCSEMHRCAVLHFTSPAAAEIGAGQCRISGGLRSVPLARNAEWQGAMCGARRKS